MSLLANRTRLEWATFSSQTLPSRSTSTLGSASMPNTYKYDLVKLKDLVNSLWYSYFCCERRILQTCDDFVETYQHL